jgi:hypothetical protein
MWGALPLLPRVDVMLGSELVEDAGVDHVGQAPSPQLTPIQDILEDRLCLSLQTPLICGLPKLRKPRTSISLFALRCSERLAAKPREPDSTKQAQSVLMQKLGIVVASPGIDSATVRKYKATF